MKLNPELERRILEMADPPKAKLSPKQKKMRKQFEGGIAKKPREKDKSRDLVFDALCTAYGLPVPEHEYHFNELADKPVINSDTGKPYAWRTDWVFQGWLAVEKEGAVWKQGRHTRGSGFVKDMLKYNCLTLFGFSLLRFTPEQFNDGSAFVFIARVLSGDQP